MKFINQVERLQTLNRLIKNERTGTPEELASCLNLGKRTLFEYIDYLKDIVWTSVMIEKEKLTSMQMIVF